MANLLKMNTNLSLHFLLLSLHILSSIAFSPQVNYLIDCGSTTTTPFENRLFQADSASDFISLAADGSINLRGENPSSNSSALYQTARVFTRESSYTFRKLTYTTHSTYVLRLHFSPFSSEGYDLSSSIFSVYALRFPLLQNFSIPSNTLLVKEFIIPITSQEFDLLFRPARSSRAFVNAIEIFSAPAELISDHARFVKPASVESFDGLSRQVLETLYRVNVGGRIIPPVLDTLWRTWVTDEDYLRSKVVAKQVSFSGRITYPVGGATRENAPEGVYRTAQEMNKQNSMAIQNFNITWNYTVKPKSRYFVRLHFCDIVSVALRDLYFNVYINENSASRNLDLSSETLQQLATPYYADFVLDSDDSGLIRVSVGPSVVSAADKRNAILNGLEIMKMNGDVGPLKPGKSSSKLGVFIGSIAGGFAFICLLIVGLCVMCKCKKKKNMMKPKPQSKDSVVWSPAGVFAGSSYSKVSEGTNASPLPNLNLELKISFVNIQFATNNFDENSLIGTGGFGNVYGGVLRDGTKVAVKRGMPGSSQGLSEFFTEITLLSKIRHRHLVSLIGYCEEQSEMILVYEFMEKGSLKSHLYGSELPCLSWKQRLEICIGSARGLHYLHTGSAQGIIHRDVKSANILLDENYLAKVADFGLSRSVPDLEQTHVSTNVKGSFGYLDPEYFRRQHLTEKSDVYSFGVVLFEVLCARPALDPSLSREQVSLAEWATHWQNKGMLDQIVDPKLMGKINSNSLRKFGETAEKCLADYGVDRPTMGDVLWNLEYALQLQETAVHSDPLEDSTSSASEYMLPPVRRTPSSNTRIMEDGAVVKSDISSEISESGIFSQLISSEGR